MGQMIREKSELVRERNEMIRARKAMRLMQSDPNRYQQLEDYDENMATLIK